MKLVYTFLILLLVSPLALAANSELSISDGPNATGTDGRGDLSGQNAALAVEVSGCSTCHKQKAQIAQVTEDCTAGVKRGDPGFAKCTHATGIASAQSAQKPTGSAGDAERTGSPARTRRKRP